MEEIKNAVKAVLTRLDDHDLLITISTQMQEIRCDMQEVKAGVRSDMQEVKDNIAGRLGAIENQVQANDAEIRKVTNKISVGIGACMALSTVLTLVAQLFLRK